MSNLYHRHSGTIELPDGRTVHASVDYIYEQDTGAGYADSDNLEIEWPDGTPLSADEYNQHINGTPLWDYVETRLLETQGEPL